MALKWLNLEVLNNKMKIYLMDNKSHVLCPSLEKGLKSLNNRVEHITLPKNHEEILIVFKEKEGGIVFLPQIWKDLLCVKIIREFQMLKTPFETVLVGSSPSISNLIVAFNNGLKVILETPIKEDKLSQAISRATQHLKQKMDQMETANRLSIYESGSMPHHYSPQLRERDQLLAHAILDIINQKGPLINGKVSILLVSTSKAQQKKLEGFLKSIGISVKEANGMEQALKAGAEKSFNVVISDTLLPDGDAVALANGLRKILKTKMPRFLVWSASPDKTSELLSPENHIDGVIIKPGPDAGIESILPSLLAGIYGTEAY